MVMQTNPSHAATEDTAAARYEVIRQFLRHILVAQRVPKGLVLLEGPLAQLFGTSRVPVRRALSLLHEEGLITRFEGRGFIVAQPDEEVEPLRLALTRELFSSHWWIPAPVVKRCWRTCRLYSQQPWYLAVIR